LLRRRGGQRFRRRCLEGGIGRPYSEPPPAGFRQAHPHSRRQGRRPKPVRYSSVRKLIGTLHLPQSIGFMSLMVENRYLRVKSHQPRISEGVTAVTGRPAEGTPETAINNINAVTSELGSSKMKMLTLLLCATIICLNESQALAATDFGNDGGRPITDRDISGKTFCWARGSRGVYAANHIYTDNRNCGTHICLWSIPEPGILKIGHSRRQTEVLPDGRLHSYQFCGPCNGSSGNTIDFWGTECN